MVQSKLSLLLTLLLVACAGLISGCNDCFTCQDTEPVAQAAAPEPQPQPHAKSECYTRCDSSFVPLETTKDGHVRSAMAYPSGEAHSSVLMVERSAPAKVAVNVPFEYVIDVTNISCAAVHDVVLTEPLSSNFKYKEAMPAPSSTSDNTLVWHLGDMEPDGSQEIIVKGHATGVGMVKDCIEVSYKPRSCLPIEVVEPKLMLSKTGPETVIQCDPIPVVLTVTNPGTGVTENVVITDQFPQGLVSQDGRKSVTINAGDLKPQESRKFELKLKAEDVGSFKNVAHATAAGDMKVSADYTVNVVKPILNVSKTGPEMRYVGTSCDYEITVTNKGNAPARDTVLTDTVPAGMAFVSASHDGAFSSGKVTWRLGTLAPNASKKVTVSLKGTAIGNMRNEAYAQAYCAQGSANFTTKIEGIPAILLEVVDVEDPIYIGNNDTYVITVTNQGSAPGTNIQVTCKLPDGQEYVGSTGPTNGTVKGQEVTFAPLASLAPKAEAEYKVRVKCTEVGDLRFYVEMVSDQMDSPVMETESTHVYK